MNFITLLIQTRWSPPAPPIFQIIQNTVDDRAERDAAANLYLRAYE